MTLPPRTPGDGSTTLQPSAREAPRAQVHELLTPTASVKVSDNDELDVWVIGDGAPIILIHGALFGSLLKPLAEELAAQGDYRAIWYRRRGYNGKPTEPVSVLEQAQDVVKILDELGIEKAHVVGHSAGIVVALALAIEAPDRLLSAAFFDGALAQVGSFGMLVDLVRPSIAKAQAGDFEGAAAAFLALLGCDQQLMERVLPGSWSALPRDAPTWFQADLPAFSKWTPDHEKFKAIGVPIAWMESGRFPPNHETGELLRKWQPTTTVLEISTDHHFFPVTASAETAAVIDGWIKSQGTTRHLVSVPSR